MLKIDYILPKLPSMNVLPRGRYFIMTLVILITLDCLYLSATLIANLSPVAKVIAVLINAAGLLALSASYPWPPADAARQNKVDSVQWIGGFLTIVVATVAVFPFVQPFNDNIFEPDTHLEIISYYQLFFLTLDPDRLPHLTSSTPYFDGPYVCYALISGVIRALSDIGVIWADLQGREELRIFTVKYTNAVLHTIAIGLLFLCAFS
jgi:hypothetical protein